MKKKIALCLIVICFAATGLWGCGVRNVRETLNIDRESDEENDIEKEDSEGVEDEKTEKEAEMEHPVLGQEDIEDYDGFEYLYCEQIRTESEKNEETGKMESKQLSVFVPIDDYVSVGRGNVMGQKLGISYKVELEPYLSYDADDYLISENLDRYLENNYDPFFSTEYEALVISEVEELDRNTARATVEYCEYSEYADDYSVVFATYLLKKIDDLTVLVRVEIDYQEVTGKTPELLAELEDFYQFEIDWDKERAEKKLEEHLAEGGNKTVSTGYFMFELPEGWKKDREASDFETYVYAPGGNSETSHCMLAIRQEYIGRLFADEDMLESSGDALVDAVKGMMSEDGMDGDVSYYGKTNLGVAVKVEVQIVGEDGNVADAHIYYVFSDAYISVVTAARVREDTENDPFALAEDILANGQSRY